MTLRKLGRWICFFSFALVVRAVPRAEVLPPDDVYILVNKQENLLTVYSLAEPNKVVMQYRAISGTNLGDKTREGDMRTPEGIYFLEREIPRRRLQRIHGPAAFELNYPNPYDRIFKRTGSGIWIHGVEKDNRLEKRFDTKGCVALGNKDVVELRQWVQADRMTPVIIVDQIIPGKPLGIESENSPLGQRIIDWARAWSSKDVDAYLSYYHENFYARKMNLAAWTKYKRRLAKVYQHISVGVSDLKIFRHEKYSVALFQQNYRSDRYQSKGWKRLYLMGEGADAKILAEEMRNEEAGPTNGEEPGSALPPEILPSTLEPVSGMIGVTSAPR
ncbi:MAG: L,D-transpeptidase family protein [Bdellovibrionales bacterium]|nr:L,D-transpeptidase family protein [Bdellovibrionales bacterium]